MGRRMHNTVCASADPHSVRYGFRLTHPTRWHIPKPDSQSVGCNSEAYCTACNGGDPHPVRYGYRLTHPTGRVRGFTLIETVLVIIIMGILAGAMAPMLSSSLTAYDELSETTSTVGKLRYAMERMAREARKIEYNGTNFEIATMSAGTLSFTKSDGVTVTLTSSGANVTLQYYEPGSALWDPAVVSTLTDQLSSLAFAYYKADGTTTTASNADVAFVQISLTLTEDGNTYPQRTRVNLRNLQ